MRVKAFLLAISLVWVAGCQVTPPVSPQAAVTGTRSLATGISTPVERPLAAANQAAAPGAPSAAGTATASAAGGIAWEEVRPNLYPMVMSPADIPGYGQAPLVIFSILDQAAIGFVVDYPDRWVFTTETQILGWGIEPSTFVGIALTNLDEHSGPPEQVVDDPTGGTYLRYSEGDGFDAARILLFDRWRDLNQAMQGRLVLAIPTRDVLYAFSDDDPAVVAQMRALTDQTYTAGPYSITRMWFTIDEDGDFAVYEAAQ